LSREDNKRFYYFNAPKKLVIFIYLFNMLKACYSQNLKKILKYTPV
jgi:hypothetical protein